MGLRERFEKIANDIVYDAASIDDLLAAVCEEEGHDALYVTNRYRDIGKVRHQITPCKRCGKGKEKEMGTHGPPAELLFDDCNGKEDADGEQ